MVSIRQMLQEHGAELNGAIFFVEECKPACGGVGMGDGPPVRRDATDPVLDRDVKEIGMPRWVVLTDKKVYMLAEHYSGAFVWEIGTDASLYEKDFTWPYNGFE